MIQEIRKQGKYSNKEVRLAAQRYLDEIGILNQQLEYFKNLLRKQKEIRKNNNLYKGLEEYQNNKERISIFLSSEIPKRLYKISFDFQEILNEFLGQEIKMIFVHVDKNNTPSLYEMTSHEVLKYDYSSRNSLIARYNMSVAETSQAIKKLQIDTKIKFSLPGLNATYKEVLERYEHSRQKGRRSVFFYDINKWKYMNISSKGDINEAYAGFILLNNVPPYFNGNLENNIKDFLQSGVAKVDNISGLLQGDISQGNIEYGIKSAEASTLGLAQIKKMAEWIVNDVEFDIEKLRKKKKEFASRGKERNKIYEDLDKIANELIAEIENKIKNLT